MTILIYISLVEWLEKHSLPCFYKKYFGIECPGCGMQRALFELLKGNIQKSFLLFPALFTILIMFFYLALHIKFKFKDGAENLKMLFILNTIIIVFNYIYRLIN
jgi:Protein of unknown function (DUF2752)